MKEQAHANAIELHFLDESGFAPTLPGGYTWAREGVRAIVPYEAPEGRRVNVIGSWVPFGDRPRLVYRSRTTSFKGPDVLEFLWHDMGGLSTPVGVVPAGYQRERPCVVVLDNYSVHKSQEIKAHAATLAAVGIHLFYLPPYSPELNLIEGLWRHLKHEELPIRSYTTVETLRQAVEAALAKRASALSVAEAACQVAPGNTPPGCTQIMAEKGGAITRRDLTTRQGAFILTADGNGLIGKSVALPLRDGNSTPSPDHPLTQPASLPRHRAAGLDH